MQVSRKGVAASVALVGAMILGGASPALADTSESEEPSVVGQAPVEASDETAPVTPPAEKDVSESKGTETPPIEGTESEAKDTEPGSAEENGSESSAQPDDSAEPTTPDMQEADSGSYPGEAEKIIEDPASTGPNSVPVTNGAAAEVRDCYWDSFDLLTHPVCNIDVTPPDMEPRNYSVSLRDIEATPAFKSLDVDLSAWYWAWETDRGAVVTFENDGNSAGLSARIDMSPRPDNPQEWSCFGGAPAPVGESYSDIPPAPEPYAATISVGETLHFEEHAFIKATGWTEVYPTDVTQLGEFDYDNTTAEDTMMAAWTPVAPGIYDFSYMFGTENCASRWFTGTITVNPAPEEPVIEEPEPEQPPVIVEPEPEPEPVADVTPVQKAAPVMNELPRTGVEPRTAWVAAFAVLAMALGIGIAAGSRRRKPERSDKE